MKALVKAAPLPALLLLVAGCQVSVDNKTKAQVDHEGDKLGADLGKAGTAVAKGAEKLGNAVEKGADAVDSGVKSHVTINGERADHASAKKH